MGSLKKGAGWLAEIESLSGGRMSFMEQYLFFRCSCSINIDCNIYTLKKAAFLKCADGV